ncbi:MAG: DUF5309 family protein [Firmicutes bacterium]|nr:DUF5309 family protein [Bacillota bacterium]
MSNISGVRTTTNISQNRRVIDMAEDIALMDPNDSPFVTFLKLAKKDTRVVYNPKFEWLEDDLLEGATTISNAAGYTASATSVKVADGSIIRVGDVLHLPASGENVLVSAVSTNTLTLVRGYGSTSAAAITNNDPVINLGPAMAENSGLRGVLSTTAANKYNYTQIFRTPFSLSGTEAASALYGGKDRGFQRRKASLEHKRDIARAMYFGQRREDTSGAAPRRTMGGVLEFLAGAESCAFDVSSRPLTYRNFDNYVAKPAFAHGSGEKLLIAGPYLASAINCWAENKLVSAVDTDTTYGIRVKDLITTYGDLKVIYDPLLDVGVYAGYGFVLDAENLRYVCLDGRDTKLRMGVQDNDVDGVIDEYLTECSLEVRCPKTHFLVTGCYIPAA